MTQVQLKWLQRYLLLVLYLLFAFMAAAQALQPGNGLVHALASVTVCAVLARWCLIDAQLKGRLVVTSFHWLLFWLWPVAVPLYLLWSRGLWGLGLASVHLLGLWTIFNSVYNAAILLM